MTIGSKDIRHELQAIITGIQDEIGYLKNKRDEIDKELQGAESKLNALRVVYQIQAERLGETKAPLFPKEGTAYLFAGMKLTEALALIRKEHPKIDKKGALKVLKKEGFDFRGKRPLPAVHFAWIALDRKKKKGR